MSNHTPRGRQYLAHAIKGAAVAAITLTTALMGARAEAAVVSPATRKNRLP